VLQNATIRLVRALRAVTPRSAREYFALAALQVRRELRDLARKEYGPLGRGANHATDRPPNGPAGDAAPAIAAAADDTIGPDERAEAAELHELVARLPAELREVVDLRVYQGLTEDEAAAVLGVSPKTLQRRWRDARIAMGRLAGEGV
jgi:RNA polymerase sigma-70 factor (ECF subfamily)